MGETLYQKVFDSHVVGDLGPGQHQLFIGLHLIHEATTAQAFAMLRERGLKVLFPERTFATADHVLPTDTVLRPYSDPLAEAMLSELEKNVADFGLRFFAPSRKEHGIVHVLGPELGLTQPGLTLCCGDSHTSTHGAFGALAFGIGTSQVRDVLATQTLPMARLKVRRIAVDGRLRPGVCAKDVILAVIRRLGVKAGVGYAYEYAGEVFDRFSMEERMTVCNMSVEAGARCGYVNPDRTTYEYLKGREFAPGPASWDRAVAYWESIRSDPDARYDDVVVFRAEDIEPMVTWGITLEQSVPVGGSLPALSNFAAQDQKMAEEAYRFMGFEPGGSLKGTRIDVAFIGSCTNGRLSDFEEVARFLRRGRFHVAPHVRALAVPGSQRVRDEVVRLGIDKVLTEAGFEFREAGCSMCLAMNTDKLEGQQVCASSSNRNFKGRQGSPTGRTLIMSPMMVAAAAVTGAVADVRELLAEGPVQ